MKNWNWVQNTAALGAFYRCEEYAWLQHKTWLRAYFSHTWDILVWNPWRIGTNSSRAVRKWYNIFLHRFPSSRNLFCNCHCVSIWNYDVSYILAVYVSTVHVNVLFWCKIIYFFPFNRNKAFSFNLHWKINILRIIQKTINTSKPVVARSPT